MNLTLNVQYNLNCFESAEQILTNLRRRFFTAAFRNDVGHI